MPGAFHVPGATSAAELGVEAPEALAPPAYHPARLHVTVEIE